MEYEVNVKGLLFVAIGVYWVIANIIKPDLLHSMRGAKTFISIFGENVYRLYTFIIAIAAIVYGLLVTANIISLNFELLSA